MPQASACLILVKVRVPSLTRSMMRFVSSMSSLTLHRQRKGRNRPLPRSGGGHFLSLDQPQRLAGSQIQRACRSIIGRRSFRCHCFTHTFQSRSLRECARTPAREAPADEDRAPLLPTSWHLFFQCHVSSHGNKGPGNVSPRITKHMYQFGKWQVRKEEKRQDNVQFIDKRSTGNLRDIRL